MKSLYTIGYVIVNCITLRIIPSVGRNTIYTRRTLACPFQCHIVEHKWTRSHDLKSSGRLGRPARDKGTCGASLQCTPSACQSWICSPALPVQCKGRSERLCLLSPTHWGIPSNAEIKAAPPFPCYHRKAMS